MFTTRAVDRLWGLIENENKRGMKERLLIFWSYGEERIKEREKRDEKSNAKPIYLKRESERER